MATTFSWVAPIAIATAISTGMNALANGAYSAASAAYDNETNHHMYLDVELFLSSLTPVAPNYCQLYLVKSLDSGTNFEDGGGAIAPLPTALACTFTLSTTTTTKRIVVANIVVPPLQFKYVLLNQAGVALGATLNTLRYRLHDEGGV